MNDNKFPVKIDSPVSTNGVPETYLRQKDFDALVTRFGYNVYLDNIIPCCCKEEGVNSARLTCRNCYGTGFVIAERIQTKVFVQQMNFPTDYKDWSIENIGTCKITTLSQNAVAFMDRIVLFEERNIYAELIYPIITSEHIIAFCAYPPVKITHCKLFQGEDKPLLNISPELLIIDNEGKIILDNIKELLYERKEYIYSNKTAISIRYEYMPSYHIIDITRNLITSPTDTPTDGFSKKGTRKEFPYSAIGRMSHLVLERGNLIDVPKEYENNVDNESTSVTEMLQGKDVSKELCETEHY